MKRLTFTLFLSFLACVVIYSQETPVERGLKAINQNVLRAQLEFLASDWTEGRMAGERGEFMAGDYIASMLKLYGVKPAVRISGTSEPQYTYFQTFILNKTEASQIGEMSIITESTGVQQQKVLSYYSDFVLGTARQTMETETLVAACGYCLIDSKTGYNDISGADIKGKIVLKIRGVPAFLNGKISSDEINLASAAGREFIIKSGAIGILEFDPSALVAGIAPTPAFLQMSASENNPSAGRPSASYSIPSATPANTFVTGTISALTAAEILKGAGIGVSDYLKIFNSQGKVQLPVIKDLKLQIKQSVKVSQVRVRNVIGLIEGRNRDQYIVIGAHYDHMGSWNGNIWNGADDNASGTVGVLTIAKAFMESGQQPEKSIIFALWTAEEEGLLGSRFFVRNPVVPIAAIKLNVNFDMISRFIADDEPNSVVMTYTDKYPQFRSITENNLKKHKINLEVDFQPSNNPPGGSDHRSFVEVGIPILRFKPGHREEYHTPNDEISTIDWDIMEKIVKISFTNAWELANTIW